jgi:ribosomal protein S18 acetylase RimI-like enzyme
MLRSPSIAKVRSAHPADAVDVAGVFRDSWTLAYRGIIPDVHLDRIVRTRDAAWWRSSLKAKEGMLVLEVGGTIAGYATCGQTRGRGRFQGEIYELYLAPTHQGLGFGEHLFEACRHALDERKLKGLLVWALVDNDAACSFYWRRGGRPVASMMEKFGSAKLEKAAFGWP